MSPAISITALEKMYKPSGRKEQGVHALKPLTLEVQRGEVFGLLGPNGAGKTTLVKLLLGIVFPTTGTATIAGHTVGTTASKTVAGYLPENHRYPPYLTGGRVLDYFGKLSGLDSRLLRTRSSELLDMVEMTKWRTTRVKKYSKGMMQRLGIAQALINDPEVVFLDEPTDGVDPIGRKEIREIIARLRAQGKTIFLNSHLLSEVEMICDRVAILDKGELVRVGTVEALTSGGNTYRIECDPQSILELIAFALENKPLRAQLHKDENAVSIEIKNAAELNAVIDGARSRGVLLTSIAPVHHSLEELFMNIIGTDSGAEKKL